LGDQNEKLFKHIQDTTKAIEAFIKPKNYDFLPWKQGEVCHKGGHGPMGDVEKAVAPVNIRKGFSTIVFFPLNHSTTNAK
jgi:hypothetical protein